MLTAKDLVFKPLRDGIGARKTFSNGYGVSVINHSGAYCDENTYEVAILKDNELYYDTPITGDVLIYQTEEQVTKIMKELQSYEVNEY